MEQLETRMMAMKLSLDEFNERIERFSQEKPKPQPHTKEELDAAYQRLLAKKQRK